MAEKVEHIGKREIAWSYAGTVFMIGAGVILLPFILHKMPQETVGIWNIFQTITYLVLLLASYFLFTAINVMVGTLVSTAKEASSFAGFIVIIMIVPFMMLNVFTDGETSNLLYFLTYFPLSAPLSLMLRAVFNNLPSWELLLGTIDIVITSFVIVRIATHVFCRNAVDFSFKNNLKRFGKTRKDWS